MDSAPVSTLAPTAPQRWWALFRQALRSEQHDYTAEPLNRALLLLAIPMVLEMVMESLFAISDVFWVARLHDDNAVAVVGMTESLMTIIYSVAIGLSMAATALVARRIGEKEPERAAHAAAQVLLLSVGLALVLGLVLGTSAEKILHLMGAPAGVIQVGASFTRWMLGGNITVFLIFVINAIFRGAGDAVIAMRTLWLANGINILLGPCLIYGWGPFPALGVTGAAIATNTGRGLGVLYQLWHLAGHHSQLKVRLRHFWPDRALMGSVFRLAGSGVLQFFINTSSWVGLVAILATFGSPALAGYTISVRIVMLALLPAWGLANAGATLAGQNLGANQPQRAEDSVWVAVRYNALFLGTVGFLFILLATPLIRLFTQDPEVIRHGARALWIVGLGFPLFGVGMAVSSAFNGAGDTFTPTCLNFACFWLGELPLGYFLAIKMGLGPTGVFISIPVYFSIFAIWCALIFRRGRWKLKKV